MVSRHFLSSVVEPQMSMDMFGCLNSRKLVGGLWGSRPPSRRPSTPPAHPSPFSRITFPLRRPSPLLCIRIHSVRRCRSTTSTAIQTLSYTRLGLHRRPPRTRLQPSIFCPLLMSSMVDISVWPNTNEKFFYVITIAHVNARISVTAMREVML